MKKLLLSLFLPALCAGSQAPATETTSNASSLNDKIYIAVPCIQDGATTDSNGYLTFPNNCYSSAYKRVKEAQTETEARIAVDAYYKQEFTGKPYSRYCYCVPFRFPKEWTTIKDNEYRYTDWCQPPVVMKVAAAAVTKHNTVIKAAPPAGAAPFAINKLGEGRPVSER